MSELRKMHVSEDDLLKQVFTAPTNPMIVIEQNSLPVYYNKVQDKLEALKDLDLSLANVLFVWEGKYKSDVFALIDTDVERIQLLLNDQA